MKPYLNPFFDPHPRETMYTPTPEPSSSCASSARARRLRRGARFLATGAAVASVLAIACTKVPRTGRTQANAIPRGIMHQVGQQSYQDVVSSSSIATGADADILERVGNRISDSARDDADGDFGWQFALIEDDSLNAWCMPGGYIGFYTGILPALESEAGMAAVMGHEVAHATAQHGAERLTQQLGVMGGLTVLQLWLSGEKDLTNEQKQLIYGAVGLGAEVGVTLPYSRLHESEADAIGLMYMADAGYPPAEAVEVWERMGQLGGARPPELLSTHPAPESRQDKLTDLLPQARKRFRRNSLPDAAETRDPLWTSARNTPGLGRR